MDEYSRPTKEATLILEDVELRLELDSKYIIADERLRETGILKFDLFRN